VNTAISECDPEVKDDVLPDAVPLLTCTGLPRLVLPSLNCTVPATTGLTVAVSVIGVPGATEDTADVVKLTVGVVTWRTGGGGLNASPTVTTPTPPTTAAAIAPAANTANGLLMGTAQLSCSDGRGC
jgi:hypothetical protein